VAGLLALMLLTGCPATGAYHARRNLVPLAEQDRTLWDQSAISEGVALVTATLPKGSVGPYQLKPPLRRFTTKRGTPDETDWRRFSRSTTCSKQCPTTRW
jgi:predicted RNA polymerase sigma factor